MLDWAQSRRTSGAGMRKIDPAARRSLRISASGGMPGYTAYHA